jgi:hypothetical protein
LAAEETAGLLSREELDHTQAGLGDGAAAEDGQPVLQVGVLALAFGLLSGRGLLDPLCQKRVSEKPAATSAAGRSPQGAQNPTRESVPQRRESLCGLQQ